MNEKCFVVKANVPDFPGGKEHQAKDCQQLVHGPCYNVVRSNQIQDAVS